MNLGDIALSVGHGGFSESKPVDIIEFVESSWGLGALLYPVQRIILKAHYGIPLDDTEKIVELSDWRQEHFTFHTEAEYMRLLYKQGRSNIEEVVEGDERREMVLSIGRRSGKCVVGDTLVVTDQGLRRIEELGDLEGSEVQPLEIGVVQEDGRQAQSKFFYSGGTRAVRTLTTRCGFQLGGTDNHRIKVLTEQGVVDWKPLADLEVGDVVCIHRNTNLWAQNYIDCIPFHNTRGRKELAFPDRLDEEWGRFLGYLVGDGLWNYEGRVEVTVEHHETWDTLKALFERLLGSYYVCMDKRTKNTGALKFSSVGMRQFLHDLGFRLGTDRDAKMVPWSVLQSPRPVVQAFLRGLFEADGGVESNGKVVSFSSASGRLAREVQTLLLNLGIVSRIRLKAIKGRVYWGLTVRGRRSRLAFAERVGFDSHKKMDPLLASFDSDREGGDTESIPHQRSWCQRLLKSVPKVTPRPGQKQAWSRSKLREVLGNTIKPNAPDEMTYPRLARALPVADELCADAEVLRHFRRLERLDYFYDPVEHVEEGREPVFDLNVPEGHEFVANGMTNHNTFLSACVVVYEVYKLLLKGSPQRYYGLGNTSEIGIVSVATGKDQAGLLYSEASGHFSECAFFHPYTANNTQTFAKFQTPADITRFGRYKDDPIAKATLKVTFAACKAKGLRGAGNMIVVLDELAHFNDVGQSDAETVYTAVKPSIATFSPKSGGKATGPVEGRIISISSPLGRQGFFYNRFQRGFVGDKASKSMFCLRAPTWEVNPTIPDTWYEDEFSKGETAFFTEYGADFTDRTRGWIEKEVDLLACVDPDGRPQQQAPSRMPHFMGIDIGLVNDGTAVAIGHLTPEKKIVLDFVEQIRAGEGQYRDQARLDFDEVAEWIYKLSRRFFIIEGIFDQWSGIPFEQALAKRGLQQLKSVHMTKNRNSEIFQNTKDMLWDRRLVLFNWPLDPGDSLCPYLQEILELQATYHSKYITTVEAPGGKHDDRSDAIVRMVWCASQNLSKPAYFAQGTGQGPRGKPQTVNSRVRQARLRARRGGTSPDRQLGGGRRNMTRR